MRRKLCKLNSLTFETQTREYEYLLIGSGTFETFSILEKIYINTMS